MTALSQREQAVLSLMCEGLDNKQIAERLGVRPGTVKVHTGRVYLKLGVKTRAQAIVRTLKP